MSHKTEERIHGQKRLTEAKLLREKPVLEKVQPRLNVAAGCSSSKFKSISICMESHMAISYMGAGEHVSCHQAKNLECREGEARGGGAFLYICLLGSDWSFQRILY